MFTEFSEAAAFVREHNVRMIDLKFADSWGRWHHVTLSAGEFTPDTMKSGVGFDGSSVGLKNVKSGDMALIPDLQTAFLDSFWELPTLSFICNTVEADTKQLFVRDPREIARRAEQFLHATGTASDSRWGPEFEFYIFSGISFENGVNTSSYRIESSEGSWNSGQSSPGFFNSPKGGYHAIPPNDHHYLLRSRMVSLIEEIGIPIKYHHHETGGPGQSEIEIPMMGLLASADAALTIKYVTRMVANQAGMSVTFLPKPLYGEAGSGMHFHQQLFSNNTNLFYDPNNTNLLSQTALFYIGGLLTHAPAVLAFTNPSTNSYRRLIPGFEAPVNCFFSRANRSAAIRIPKYATQPDKVRMEFRPPDGTCNPYLAMAAMLMAGIDGIRRKIDPTIVGFGPIDDDIFAWSPDQRSKIKNLPTSLEESLQALQKDYAFLLEGNVFDESLIQDWISSKQKEDYELRIRPHPFEIQKYFDY